MNIEQPIRTGAREAVQVRGPAERGAVEPEHHGPRQGQRDMRAEAPGVRVGRPHRRDQARGASLQGQAGVDGKRRREEKRSDVQTRHRFLIMLVCLSSCF